MSNITQFFPGGGGSNNAAGTPLYRGFTKQNRAIFIGPTSVNWTVPQDVTEIEVHCWGGGGNGSTASVFGHGGGGGGGGGGYVFHVYPVVKGDILAITVGGQGGTSSVTVPTQSPTNPISATGGSNGTLVSFPVSPQGGPGIAYSGYGGLGGSGSYTIASGISTAYSITAKGGSGGNTEESSYYAGYPYAYWYISGAGGGAAGSPYGNGGDGGSVPKNSLYENTPGYTKGGGGGAIGGNPGKHGGYGGYGPPSRGNGGSIEIAQYFISSPTIQSLNTIDNYKTYNIVGFGTTTINPSKIPPTNSLWFYVGEITGFGAGPTPSSASGAGSGGGGEYGGPSPTYTNGTFLGGGGGSHSYWFIYPGGPYNQFYSGGNGGLCGGGGGGSTTQYSPTSGTGTGAGGAGVVIIYW